MNEYNRIKERLLFKHMPTNVPQSAADKAFSLAWEQGHAYGEKEIESQLINIVDILKEMPYVA